MSVLQSWPVQREFDRKNMPFRRLGPSGLRVPLFSLGGCKSINLKILRSIFKLNLHRKGLTLGGTVTGDPVKVRKGFRKSLSKVFS